MASSSSASHFPEISPLASWVTCRGTGTLEACHQRRGKRARSPFGDGKAHSLRQGTEHPPEEPATRRLGTEVGMKGVAGQEEGSPLTAKVLLSQTTHRRDARSPQLEQPLQADTTRQPHTGTHGRKWAQQRAEDAFADHIPAGH